MIKITEADIQSKIRIELTRLGHTVFRVNVGSVRTSDGRIFKTGLPKGHSDLYGFRPDGQIFYIEVKSVSGKIRPEQIKFLRTMKDRGALVGVAKSVEDALEIVGGVKVH